MTYRIAIHCLICDRISYNNNDVNERYCGYCKRFHDDARDDMKTKTIAEPLRTVVQASFERGARMALDIAESTESFVRVDRQTLAQLLDEHALLCGIALGRLDDLLEQLNREN